MEGLPKSDGEPMVARPLFGRSDNIAANPNAMQDPMFDQAGDNADMDVDACKEDEGDEQYGGNDDDNAPDGDEFDDEEPMPESRVFTRLAPRNVTVRVRPTDERMLVRFKIYAKAITEKFQRRARLVPEDTCVSDNQPRKSLVKKMIKVFFKSYAIESLLDHISEGLTVGEPSVTRAEFGTFLRLYCMMSAYGLSPTAFFSERTGTRGSLIDKQTEMTIDRFMAITRAIDRKEPPADRNTSVETLDQALDAINRANSFLFLRAIDLDISCDDLKMYMRSLRAKDFGYVVSTSNKQRCITMTCAVSPLTGFLFGSSMIKKAFAKGTRKLESFRRCVRSMSSQAYAGALSPLSNSIFYIDRGYLNKAFRDYVSKELKSGYLGTIPLNYWSAFLHGRSEKSGKTRVANERTGQTVVPDTGSRGVYYSIRRTEPGSRGKTLVAAYRKGGFSSVGVVETNIALDYSSQWALVPRSKQYTFGEALSGTAGPVSDLWTAFKSRVKMLTMDQGGGDVCWLYFRIGLLTSSVARSAMMGLRTCPDLWKDHSAIAGLLSINIETEERDVGTTQYSLEMLQGKRNQELKDILGLYNLSKSGNKNALMQRIIDAQDKGTLRAASLAKADIGRVVIPLFFEPPVDREWLRTGSLNEVHIMNQLKPFLAEYGFELIAARTLGLASSRTNESLATSVDAWLVIKTPSLEILEVVAEFKTASSDKTQDAATLMFTEVFGTIYIENCSVQSTKALLGAVKREHIVQIMHHCITTSVSTVAYVLSKPGGTFIRFSLVTFSEEVLYNYGRLISEIDSHTCFLRDPNLPLPANVDQMSLASSFCPDLETLQCFRLLRAALVKLFEETGSLPRGDLIPLIIDHWNRFMCGIDVVSTIMAHVEMHIQGIGPIGRILFTSLMWQFHQVFVACKICCLPLDTITSYTEKQNKWKKLIGPFGDFLIFVGQCIDEVFHAEQEAEKAKAKLAPMSSGKKRSGNFIDEWNEEERVAFRLDRDQVHDSARTYGKKKAYCAYCGGTRMIGGRVVRVGRQTRSYCTACNVPLCSKPFSTTRSENTTKDYTPTRKRRHTEKQAFLPVEVCHKIWHETEVLQPPYKQ